MTTDFMRTRFAPSPSGHLHLGHAYSALFCFNKATEHKGEFILRIEDIDTTRCRPEFEQDIYDDLHWLGLSWPTPVRRQSDHMADYQAALDNLGAMGLLYPCFCTRRDIMQEIERSGGAPHGPDGHLYPRLCHGLPPQKIAEHMDYGAAYALRLDVEKAMQMAREKTDNLTWFDHVRGEQILQPEIFGDVVLARKDIKTSYHLSVTIDDDIQDIDVVTRGMDLFEASHIHVLLQILLDLKRPTYHHHELIKDDDGKRLAKRDQARSLKSLRDEGYSTEDIYKLIGLRPYSTGAHKIS